MTLRLIVTDLTGIVVAAFQSALEADLAHVNIHDATFPVVAASGCASRAGTASLSAFFGDLRLSHSLR